MRTGLLIFVLFLTLAFFTFARKGPAANTAAQSTPASQMIVTEGAQTYSALSPAAASSTAPAATNVSAKVDFASQIRPILEGKCKPCHFNGGTMYERLPFDRPETIRTLGTKLFTRIKEENDRCLIREFLAQN
ncbi:MAG: hypothetical protein ACREBG_13170 [Pyrinomonadaceae bacterium]